jgi:hypothetical protein
MLPELEREHRLPTSDDRDAATGPALARLIHENERLKALVVSLSKLVIKNVVGQNTDKDKSDAKILKKLLDAGLKADK